LFSLLPLLYVVLGFLILAQGGPGQEVGLFFVVVFGSMAAYLILLVILSFIGGIYLHRRKGRTFCYIVAAVQCTFLPLGTIRGVSATSVRRGGAGRERFAVGGKYHARGEEDGSPPREQDRNARSGYDARDDWRVDRRDEPGYYGGDSDHD